MMNPFFPSTLLCVRVYRLCIHNTQTLLGLFSIPEGRRGASLFFDCIYVSIIPSSFPLYGGVVLYIGGSSRGQLDDLMLFCVVGSKRE